MLIDIRNRDQCLAFSARANAAGLKVGQVVKFVQGAAAGDQPKVAAVTAADLDDATITKGIVWYRPKDSTEDVDFTFDPATLALTAASTTIPNDAQVTVFTGRPIVAYHKSVLGADLQPGSVREADKVAFLVATQMPGDYNGAATDTGAENFMGLVYRIDGPEITIAFTKL